MQTLEQANQRAADLYWLAYLLTGQQAASVESIEEALEGIETESTANAFFSDWMLAWSRRVVIARALAHIREDLAMSASRTKSRHFRHGAPRDWAFDQDLTKIQLERALLTIDIFPRCAVLLTIFEKVCLEDVAVLLDADAVLIRK